MSTGQAKYPTITIEELEAHAMTLEEMHERLTKKIKDHYAQRGLNASTSAAMREAREGNMKTYSWIKSKL